MLAAALNRFSGVSRLAIDTADLEQIRVELLIPYLRQQFAETAAVASRLLLRPVEIAVLADSQLAIWAFHDIDKAIPAWIASVAGIAASR